MMLEYFTRTSEVNIRTMHVDRLAAHQAARDESIKIAREHAERGCGQTSMPSVYVCVMFQGHATRTDVWTNGACMGYAGVYDPIAGEGIYEQRANTMFAGLDAFLADK